MKLDTLGYGYGSLGQAITKPAEHHNRDPDTGACLDCGCKRDEIDDLVSCDPIPAGPNRLAVIALKRELRSFEAKVSSAEKQLRCVEDSIPRMTQNLQEALAQRDELLASIGKLRQNSGH